MGWEYALRPGAPVGMVGMGGGGPNRRFTPVGTVNRTRKGRIVNTHPVNCHNRLLTKRLR